jgi:hypothetical protein
LSATRGLSHAAGATCPVRERRFDRIACAKRWTTRLRVDLVSRPFDGLGVALRRRSVRIDVDTIDVSAFDSLLRH